MTLEPGILLFAIYCSGFFALLKTAEFLERFQSGCIFKTLDYIEQCHDSAGYGGPTKEVDLTANSSKAAQQAFASQNTESQPHG